MRPVFVAMLTICTGCQAMAGERIALTSELDRIAHAVDGAESSHGKDPRMWRPDATGPQGPMQVGEKAAVDVGGGNRFDVGQNRIIGRAYLALLHRRYGNWLDAVSAYNWGLGRLDLWISAGRPPEKLVPGVAKYVGRVLHDSGLCAGAAANPDCSLSGSTYPALPTMAGGRPPSSFSRSLAKAERLAARIGRE